MHALSGGQREPGAPGCLLGVPQVMFLRDGPRASSQSLALMSPNLGACFFFNEDVHRISVANEHHCVLVLCSHKIGVLGAWASQSPAAGGDLEEPKWPTGT